MIGQVEGLNKSLLYLVLEKEMSLIMIGEVTNQMTSTTAASDQTLIGRVKSDKMAAVPRPGEGEEPDPDYDWSNAKPGDSLWKKDEPNYDWSGARPEEPFDRPRDMMFTDPSSQQLD